MSLMALVSGIDAGLWRPTSTAGARTRRNSCLELLKAQGEHPSYASPSLFHIHAGLYALMANHEYGVPAFDPDAVTEATIRARREVYAIVRALRKAYGPGRIYRSWRRRRIGIREGRRIAGATGDGGRSSGRSVRTRTRSAR